MLWHLCYHFLQILEQVLRGCAIVEQNAPSHFGFGSHIDEACADAIPLFECLRAGAFVHAHRLAASHEIAGQERFSRQDVADLIEAHDGTPQSNHVTLARHCLFPSPTPQIVVDDIAPLAVLPREEILEGAAPEVHEGGADQRLELVGLDAMPVTCPEVHVEHGEEGFAPVVMTEPFHQTEKGLDGRHIVPWVGLRGRRSKR